MRTFEDIKPLLQNVSHALTKYTIIDRMDFDFGVGVPLYPAEIHMLEAINRRNKIGVTELAKEFGITKGAVSQLVGKLVKKELVVKEKDLEHKARVIIKPTKLGRKACKNHAEFHEKHDQAFFEYLRQLDDESFNVALELSNHMNLWMDKYLK